MPTWFVIATFIAVIVYTLVRTFARQYHAQQSVLAGEPAWLWFTTVPGQRDIARVGLTDEPPEAIMPMDKGIVVLYKEHVENRRTALTDITANLGGARSEKRGAKGQSFYDIEVVKAYISHLKGEW